MEVILVSVKDFSEVHQINHPPNLTQQPPWQAHLAGHPLCFNQHFHLSFHGWCFSTRQLNQTRRSNHETAPLPPPSCEVYKSTKQTFETVIIECFIDIIYNYIYIIHQPKFHWNSIKQPNIYKSPIFTQNLSPLSSSNVPLPSFMPPWSGGFLTSRWGLKNFGLIWSCISGFYTNSCQKLMTLPTPGVTKSLKTRAIFYMYL